MDPYGDTGFGRVRVSRSVVNMFENAQMRRILNHSLGLEYDYELSGDDEETWVQHQIDMANLTSCGYGHGPHGHHGPRSSSFTYRQPQRSTASTCCPSPVKVPPGDSDSERKTRLLQESKKEKERAERKKKKKMKQKERKRREKLKKENKVTGKKEEEGDDDDDDAERSEPEECERDKSEEGAKGEASEDQESKSEVESSNEDNDSCASEELDMSSSFVSKAALIAKRQLDQKAKAMKVEKVSEKECKISVEKPDEAQQADNKELVASSSPSFEDVIKISTDLAVIGNKYASAGDFVTAVRYFTDAIKYNPTEFKLFGNRSLCFEKMQEYEKALADAELSLGIRPGWVKGLFRKGKALAGLKRYDEAASALKEVLKLDACCVEAAQELMQVQIIQLMEFGFTREQSSNALIIHRTVEKALEVLSKINHTAGAAQISQNLPTVQVANANGVSPVLSATKKLSPGGAAAAPSSTRAPDAARNFDSDKPARPSHNVPRELFPVWVGSLDPTITGELLYNLFNKVGTVVSIKVLTYKRCAFVNFTKQEFCEEAIQRYNGHDLNGIRIAVRYPDRIPAGMGISSSAHRASHQQNDNSFHKRNQSGNRRPF